MHDPSHPSSPPAVAERRKEVKGIDFSRAYHALIKGYVQAHTTRKLQDIVREKELQGEQR